MAGREIHILETTLRDGNYLVDFQFTAADTAWLCRELEECGIELIEIGHGLGLGASRLYAPAAASDEDYIKAARANLKRAKFGMFAIPSVATLDDIAMAADLGMNFVRIGTNVDQVREMKPFVAEARRRGMFVCTNFMKSYCLPPDEFGEIAALAEDFGSQMNYVVDSAGGMLPDDVRAYFAALDAKTSIPMGFHGHDNIRLAIANSLVAVECGAEYIDTTLFGIGRCSGNAATELLVAILKRLGTAFEEVDDLRLIQLAEREAAPMLRHRYQESISMSLGLAQVHSMYSDQITARAHEEQVAPHQLIRRVGDTSRLKVDDEILNAAVAAVRADAPGTPFADGGLLSLPAGGSVSETVAAAENLAEKIGVSCDLWVAGGAGEPALEVVREPGWVEIRVFGDPRPAVAAARRPVTRVLVAPRAAAALAGLVPGGPDIVVEMARTDPRWLADAVEPRPSDGSRLAQGPGRAAQQRKVAS